jgi:hypothetical protein
MQVAVAALGRFIGQAHLDQVVLVVEVLVQSVQLLLLELQTLVEEVAVQMEQRVVMVAQALLLLLTTLLKHLVERLPRPQPTGFIHLQVQEHLRQPQI